LVENLSLSNEAYETTIRPVVEGLGFDLVQVKVARAGSRSVVRILADLPGGGIGLADCARISRAVGVALDEAQTIKGSFTLELSSPGLDWHIESPHDFRRYLGQKFKLQMQDGGTLEGTLTAATDQHLTLEDTPEPVPFEKVNYGTRNY
jgi:ribosome maturation factor RimP